ncbi:uncharacterized protein At3g17950 isoform X2 [Alnus glutinosa]|uniref:uncharacterized protein At3g17950 isoform X2 n=1 Tax=Alnus glutinosa TaxID=3517 RepID=UPI002D76A6A1|nr:uncharacterized protein At3g17950 isoform X2 [Alnus glutinosa]
MQAEEGWPLGLRPLNARVGFVRNRDLSGSVSFSTLLTGSPTSTTISSSDLETESTGSLFHDKSITLGSLIGVSSILELSRRSTRGRTAEASRDRRNYKHKPWLFSLCSKLTTDAVNGSNAPSLRHFLEAERRTASVYRRNQSPTIYGPTDFSPTLPTSDTNSLFVGGRVGPQSSAPLDDSGGRKSNNQLLDGNGYGAPLLFSCLRGYLMK